MPKTLKEIKEVASKNSLKDILADPARNSVIGNIQKLYDETEAFAESFEGKNLREDLKAILDGFGSEDKEMEEAANNAISRISGPMNSFYLTQCANTHSTLDDKKKQELQDLMGYVTAGLNLGKMDFPVTDKQQADVQRAEEQGKKEVQSEKAAAEEKARVEALEKKSGLNVLDEHKAAIAELPRVFSGENAAEEEKAARKKLKDLCIDIMATRRSINANRNDKSGLAKSKMDAALLKSIRKDMAKSTGLDAFFESMTYLDLRKLAYDGHGGKMEETFKKYLRTNLEIPGDAPEQYMPTAKEHIEALQSKIDDTFKKHTAPKTQCELYVELLATRAAVNAARNKKTTLAPVINPAHLAEEREKLKKEPLSTALARATDMGEKQQAACKEAITGHGGGLEDLMKKELRDMAMEEEFGYRMQQVDARFAPTYDQRKSDLQTLLNGGELTPLQQLNAAVELNVLNNVQQDGPEGHLDSDPIEKIDSINRQTDMKLDLYKKIMGENDMKAYAADTLKSGPQTAAYNFESAHMGEIKAINLREKLDQELANPDLGRDDLANIAAQKMVLLKHRNEFQQTKDNDKLAKALEKENMAAEVEEMRKHHLFAEMVEKLGKEGLQKQVQGDGAELAVSYGLAKQDKLEYYKPEQAPVKANQKDGPQAGDPQANGPQNGPVA